MGVFDLFKKKKNKEEINNSPLILSMPLFSDSKGYSIEAIVKDLKEYWGLKIEDFSGDNNVATFEIGTEKIAFAFMPVPIPNTDLESIYDFNYLWKNNREEIPKHQSHAIVSIFGSQLKPFDRYALLSKLNASIMRTTESAMGIYQGNQTLLIQKNVYLDFADMLLEDISPIQLWVYIGVISQEKSSIYTFGMKEFGKKEIEIIHSDMNGDELYDFLLPVLNYILEYDVTLLNGETIGFTEEQKIKITVSKGVYIDEESIKLTI